ncbi:hypothetical protein HMN09_00774700 [Mycena chlorophos]|uniref:Uncharacterized protein n=1 Tax=Mycena chlorophos TaxID=658473 RepID=A0A8H6SSF6_MYCCL|nr:hypothetical protein HMN09_00774700 [Mycena chlorophos]
MRRPKVVALISRLFEKRVMTVRLEGLLEGKTLKPRRPTHPDSAPQRLPCEAKSIIERAGGRYGDDVDPSLSTTTIHLHPSCADPVAVSRGAGTIPPAAGPRPCLHDAVHTPQSVIFSLKGADALVVEAVQSAPVRVRLPLHPP